MRSMTLVIVSRVIEALAIILYIAVVLAGLAAPISLLPHESLGPFQGGFMIMLQSLAAIGGLPAPPKGIRKPLSGGQRAFFAAVSLFELGFLTAAAARNGWLHVALAAFAGAGVATTLTVICWSAVVSAVDFARKLRAPREAFASAIWTS